MMVPVFKTQFDYKNVKNALIKFGEFGKIFVKNVFLIL